MIIYLASGNPGKCAEFNVLLDRFLPGANLLSLAELGGMPSVEENGNTFEANAEIKARAILDLIPDGAWALADDSGLLVDALEGEPGVRSARYAGPQSNATENNAKLLQALEGILPGKRAAHFACVLCFMKKDTPPHFFKGTCSGHIVSAPSGAEGFGYDPLFQPLGYQATFAELGREIKNELSHRTMAIKEWAVFARSLC